MMLSKEAIYSIAIFLLIIAGIIYYFLKIKKSESQQIKDLKQSENALKDIKKDVRSLTEPEKRSVAKDISRFKAIMGKLHETIKKLEKDKKMMEELNQKMKEISASHSMKQAKKAGQVYHLIETYRNKYIYDIKVIDNVILQVKKEIDVLIIEVSKFPKHEESLTLMHDLKVLAKRVEPIEAFYIGA